MVASAGGQTKPKRPFFFICYLITALISIIGFRLSVGQTATANIGQGVFGSMLLLFGSLSVLDFGSFRSARQGLIAIGIIAALGTTFELIGIFDPSTFGHYRYGTRWNPFITLGPNHLHFPVLIGFAWVMIAGAWAVAFSDLRCQQPPYPSTFLNKMPRRAIPLNRSWLALCLTAVASVATDFFMEPLAIKLGYWHWIQSGPLPGHAPWENSLGWLVASAIIGRILYGFLPPKPEVKPSGAGTWSRYAALIPLVHLAFLFSLTQLQEPIGSGSNPVTTAILMRRSSFHQNQPALLFYNLQIDQNLKSRSNP